VKERNAFPNLMLLCPRHHKRVDQLEPDEFPPDRLLDMKEKHERSTAHDWASDDELSRYAGLLIHPIYVAIEIEAGRAEMSQHPNTPPHRSLRAIRMQAGPSLTDLAREVSISKSYLSNIEAGRYMPSASVQQALAEALHFDARTMWPES
jgi:DNA-binding XRE family transcriptional regulator